MTSQAHHHRPLRQNQLLILRLLYRFRFATTELLTQQLGPTTKVKINRRLMLLVEQGYLGRRYDASYHLSGRHASFYLVGKGINALKQLPAGTLLPSVLRNFYKDEAASDRFINHWLEVFALSCRLKAQYGERIRVFTKTELAAYHYFPRPAPDVYLRLADGSNERHYFLELLDVTQPFFVQIKRLTQYAEYAEAGDWEDATGTELPVAVLVCSSPAAHRKLLKYVDNELDYFDEDDGLIVITTPAELGRVIGK